MVRPFDADRRGMMPGEGGFGVVVVEPPRICESTTRKHCRVWRSVRRMEPRRPFAYRDGGFPSQSQMHSRPLRSRSMMLGGSAPMAQELAPMTHSKLVRTTEYSPRGTIAYQWYRSKEQQDIVRARQG